MKRRVKQALVALLPLLGSCWDIGTEENPSLSLELTASATSTSIDQAVEFTFSATGSFLVLFTLDFGDGVVERVEGRGSESLAGERTHAWDTAGIYRVVGTLDGGAQGTRTREITIEVTGP